MSEVPDRISVAFQPTSIFTRQEQFGYHKGGFEFIRLDTHEAAVAAARKEGMLDAAELCDMVAGYWRLSDEEDGRANTGAAVAEGLAASIRAEASK